ncbi:fluoride efflux transporter FluC [Natrialba asiatica]|uniref:Fluoride-specific ion channel FluC n=1 Tax=Natrialba asiatica (strain ATCC 700177 / DSM 12278 / JCM 9576 / FERM P-10747 / NBRC 102637 / 172P1) TaxID=29540 RepID=M0AI83_NATA1|nr:CrcB family protein [Natrialba asiatica]ELY98410.1 CrcB protein [Natrialba asiatica DSM 12278]
MSATAAASLAELWTAIGGPFALVSVPDVSIAAVTFDPEPAHVVGTGGAIGAVLRYGVYQRLSSDRFPWPTLLVNVVGSFAFALAMFAGATESVLQLLGTGLCGAFTTFSSFSVETVQSYERGDRLLAVGNAGANLGLALAGIGLAWIVVALGPV